MECGKQSGKPLECGELGVVGSHIAHAVVSALAAQASDLGSIPSV